MFIGYLYFIHKTHSFCLNFQSYYYKGIPNIFYLLKCLCFIVLIINVNFYCLFLIAFFRNVYFIVFLSVN